MPTKIYDLATKVYPLVASWLPNKMVNFGSCFYLCDVAIPLACTVRNINFQLLIETAARDSSVQSRCTPQGNLQANQRVANSRSLDEGKK